MSFYRSLACICACFGENYGKLRTARSTSATEDQKKEGAFSAGNITLGEPKRKKKGDIRATLPNILHISDIFERVLHKYFLVCLACCIKKACSLKEDAVTQN